MSFHEAILLALNQLTLNKLRFFLTLLGIIIGIAAVITLMAIGNGAVNIISGQFETMGANMIFVQFDYSKEDITPENLKEKDIRAIRKGSDLTQNITPADIANTEIKTGRDIQHISITGIGENFLQVQGLKLERGRFFNTFEANSSKFVCVLGADLHEKLFGKRNGIGRTIRLQGKRFLILGVMEKSDQRTISPNGLTDNMRLYIPVKTLHLLWKNKGYPVVLAQPVDTIITKAAVRQIRGILARLYGPKNNFIVQSMEELLAANLERLHIFLYFLAGLGGIALLIGGIGIMNIMLVTVKERTQEIGIQKAFGAKQKDILLQFLIEAVILCLIGGLIGIGLGFLLTLGIRSANIIPAMVSISSILIAIVFSITIGLFFGIYPAWKAARLDPIESLRYE